MVAVVALFVLLLAIGWPMYRWWVLLVAYAAAFGLMAAGPHTIDAQVFTWIKLASLLPVGLTLTWFTRLGPQKRTWAARFIVAMLGLNIAEAMLADAWAGRWLNSLVAVCLILSMPEQVGMKVREDGTPGLALSWIWIATYTVWNWAFVLGTYPTRGWDHLAVLLASVTVAICKHDPAAWLTARLWTLAAYALLVVTAKDAWGLPWLIDFQAAEATRPLVVIVACLGAVVLAYQRLTSRVEAA